MSTWVHKAILAVALGLISAEAAVSQETEVLLLPQDQERLDELTVVGSTWTPGLDGLASMTVPSSSSTIYVVDQVAALQGEISAALGSLWRNDSDISIRFGAFGDEFAHLRTAAEGIELRYFRFEDDLREQLRAFVEEGFVGGDRAVKYLEYGISSGVCAELDATSNRVLSTLSTSMSDIGRRPEAGENILVLDGAYYWVAVRMGGLLEGQFGVGGNAGPLYEAVHSFALALRECRKGLEPQGRRHVMSQ